VRGPRAQNLADAREYPLSILQNIVVPKAQPAKAMALEEACPDLVALDVDRMLPPIDLNHHSM